MENNRRMGNEVAILKETDVTGAPINPKFVGPTAEELARLSLTRWLDEVLIDTREKPDRLARFLNQGSSQE